MSPIARLRSVAMTPGRAAVLTRDASSLYVTSRTFSRGAKRISRASSRNVQVGARDKPHRLRLAVLHMLRVHRQQGSEQRRQHAPHVAEVLQNLSVKRSNATSCNSSRTPRERT